MSVYCAVMIAVIMPWWFSSFFQNHAVILPIFFTAILTHPYTYSKHSN